MFAGYGRFGLCWRAAGNDAILYRDAFLVQDPGERLVSEAATDKFLEHYAATGPRAESFSFRTGEQARLTGVDLRESMGDNIRARSMRRRAEVGLLAELIRCVQVESTSCKVPPVQLCYQYSDAEPVDDIHELERQGFLLERRAQCR